MSGTNIEAMRKHLMDTLADLRNPEKPMEVDRARAIAQVASALIDSARVEVEFLKTIGDESATGTGFIPKSLPGGNGGSWSPKPGSAPDPALPGDGKPLPKGVLGVTQHRLR